MNKSERKKSIMWILIPITLIVIAFMIAFTYVYTMLSMKPAATGEIAGTDIIAVQDNRNAIYFFKTENGFIVIDAGSDKDKLESTLNKLSIDPMKVSHVFITHSDSDHIAGLNLFPEAQVYINEDEMQMLDGSVKRSVIGFNTLPDGFDKGKLVYLTDDQELLIDDFSILCIKSPGHTLGSMSFLVNNTYLFTGDALRVHKDDIFISPFSMDKGKSTTTINHLYDLMDECQFVLTAHYGYHCTEHLQVH